MTTLKELIKVSNEIEEALFETGGELNEALEAKLIELQKNLPTKIDAYAVIIERAELQAEFLKKKIDSLNKLKKSIEAVSDRLKENIKDASASTGLTKFEGSEYSFTVSRVKPKVDITDEMLLTDAFLDKVITYKPNKEKISEALKSGAEVPGARLLESYSVRLRQSVKG